MYVDRSFNKKEEPLFQYYQFLLFLLSGKQIFEGLFWFVVAFSEDVEPPSSSRCSVHVGSKKTLHNWATVHFTKFCFK